MASIQERLSRSNCPGDIKAHCRCIDSRCRGDIALMTKASGAMLQNTTLNGGTVIADYTKSKAAIDAASFRERSIRTTLNYIE